MNFHQEGVRVGPCEFGLGVFSLRTFSPKRLIGHIPGEIHRDPDYGSDYCMELGDHTALEPDPPFRYLNHSCQPNCALVEVEVEHENGSRAGWEIWLEALRDIAPGEQMTIDYNWPASAAIPCTCGSPHCRGWIVNAEDPGRHALSGGEARAGGQGGEC